MKNRPKGRTCLLCFDFLSFVHTNNIIKSRKNQYFYKKIIMKNNPIISNFNYKKCYGQNFIYDQSLLESIADDAMLSQTDQVLEIGAGAGSLTKVLCERCQKVISYEIDKNLFAKLNSLKQEHNNLSFVFDDFMSKSNENIIAGFDKKFKVVANIPYYITTPIIFKLLDMIDHIKSITLMVQKEVAERVSSFTTADNSVLTYSVLAKCDARICQIVPKEKFTPPPKVDSAVLMLVPHNNRYKIDDYDQLRQFVKGCFVSRRKTLANNLSQSFKISKQEAEQLLRKMFHSENIRAQELGIEDFIALNKEIKKQHE